MRFILGRLLQSVILVFLVATVIFFIVRMTGDPKSMLLPPWATNEVKAALEKRLGLDKPLIIQYKIFMVNMLHGDFGTSFASRQPCLDLFMQFFPNSVLLAVSSMVVSLLIAIPVGVYTAKKRGGVFDFIGRTFAYMGQAAPIFWVGLLGILFFSVKLHLLPAGGMGGIISLILPTITVGWVVSSGLLRLTRSSMIDILNFDYIRMARAKGLAEGVVLWKHAFRNAALPVLTFFVLLFINLLASSIVTETVFSWPGVGRLMMNAVVQRDFPVVQTVVVLVCIMFIMANFLADVLYTFLNPKIRYG